MFQQISRQIIHAYWPYEPQVRGCAPFLTELFPLVSFSLLVCAVAVLVQYCMSMLIDCTLFFSALGCLHPASQTKCMCVNVLTWEGLNGVVCSVVRTCGCESIRVCVWERRWDKARYVGWRDLRIAFTPCLAGCPGNGRGEKVRERIRWRGV